MPAALLNIAALSRRTGVAADTLRKWEQRYGVLRPERTAGGQRRYSEADVQRVEWLRDRINDGWRIGEAARVLDGAETAALDDPAELRESLIAAVQATEPQTCRCDARSGVLRPAARAGADGRRYTRLALGRRGLASRRAVDRPGARDLGEGPPAPGEAPGGRSGWSARHGRAGVRAGRAARHRTDDARRHAPRGRLACRVPRRGYPGRGGARVRGRDRGDRALHQRGPRRIRPDTSRWRSRRSRDRAASSWCSGEPQSTHESRAGSRRSTPTASSTSPSHACAASPPPASGGCGE